ncbi:ethanolamine ammonia-lyase subunit EutC [Paroceanicella profunda]|uniref:Ethanolamine ammonia-lyase small subunit n=1 Tax=Paroceanicella profunda TaxID=2579971 RepID=A0A5B8FX35_9RHOB|nr:ethanolamine ammonia-lyase subunit EutC [Paroceanicella profunda]QDL93466.1 ethanolamine ammonia-lyase subunit EutC [Paroceanicella profunda]
MSGAQDLWETLRRHTPARIGLGRSGISLPTARALEFQLAHARARTAVHSPLDTGALGAALTPLLGAPLVVASRAGDRATYLQRPDLGRRLSTAAHDALDGVSEAVDVAIVVADGLSALAVEQNAPPFLEAFLPRLAEGGLRLARPVIATQARVAIGDEIGRLLRARVVVMLIGERPGLSAADSLGLYLTFGPRPGRTDADRNCISNIRPGGLSHAEAAYRAQYLLGQSLLRGLSGVQLKDDTVAEALPSGDGPNVLLGS